MTRLPRGIWERPRGSKIYWIRYTDPDGKRRREKCGSLTNAKERLAIRHAERLSGQPLATKPIKSFTLSTLIDDALAYAQDQNNAYSAKDLGYKMERIRKDFGRAIARNITQADIMRWLEKQSVKNDWRPASRNRYQAAWSLVFRLAMQNKKMRENPVHGLRQKREDNQRVRVVDDKEERDIEQAISERFPDYLPIFRLALDSGMRVSEMFRSEVGDFNPKTGLFQIRQTKVRNGDPMRRIPASSRLQEAYRQLSAGKNEGDLLCTKTEPRGGTREMNRISYWFNPCVKAAGIKKKLTWHDLRHTYASRLVMGGVVIPAVSTYMGHQSLQMTMRYSHFSPDFDSKTKAVMDARYDPKRAPERAPALASKYRLQVTH